MKESLHGSGLARAANDDAGASVAPVSVAAEGITKVFADGTRALDDVSLTVHEGEFVAIIGPSGCGKSTFLRTIAGLSKPSSGQCRFDEDSTLAFVFQQPTLLPWRTSVRNAELLLKLEGYGRRERRERALDAMRLVGLEGFESAYPRALSGGMKMRLSLARALALAPDLFLLDEPFSALDEITREALNDELARIWYETQVTSILVTHNLYEAIFLAQRVVVMSPRPGRIMTELQVPFSYPRTPQLRESPEYLEQVGILTKELRKTTQ